MTGVRLRRATVNDVQTLEQWDTDPDVISATTDDDDADRAFGGLDWRDELNQSSDVSYYLIAELDGRPIGAMQICDPHEEPTHYWGEIEPHLRAIDIWIGAPDDRGKGHGTEMMRQAHAHCFADAPATAMVMDPLASNIRAHAFYQRLGYLVVGPRAFGDDECLVHRLARSA